MVNEQNEALGSLNVSRTEGTVFDRKGVNRFEVTLSPRLRPISTHTNKGGHCKTSQKTHCEHFSPVVVSESTHLVKEAAFKQGGVG